MDDYKLHRKSFIPQSLDRVFDFFSKAENLELLTPQWLRFKILTPLPIHMKKGTLIDYQITLLGIPMKWQTLIKEWDPPHSFIDSQLKGPYTKWEHLHQFKEENGGTTIIDEVNYRIPGNFLSPLLHNLFVKPQLNSIFNFRQKVLGDHFK